MQMFTKFQYRLIEDIRKQQRQWIACFSRRSIKEEREKWKKKKTPTRKQSSTHNNWLHAMALYCQPAMLQHDTWNLELRTFPYRPYHNGNRDCETGMPITAQACVSAKANDYGYKFNNVVSSYSTVSSKCSGWCTRMCLARAAITYM